MAKKIFSTSGFGEKFTNEPKSIIDEKGGFNVTKIGGRPRTIYHYLMTYSWSQFLLLILMFYLAINALFAFAYVFVGINHLGGIPVGSVYNNYLYCFFFSVQTFTTVGYGNIAPIGIGANIVATIEAMSGLLCFAIITGLLYGRFSRPNTRIRFSKNILIVPTKKLSELHFQIVNERNDVLLHPQVQLLIKMNEKTESGVVRRFYELPLQISKIVFFPLNWRVVHAIDENSPLFGLTHEQILASEIEFLILMNAYDNVFMQTVYKWHEFLAKDIVMNARFLPAYSNDETGQSILVLDDIDKFERL